MILTAALTIIADQIFKTKINENITEGEYKEIVKDKFYLGNVKNKGMAMGSFSKNRKFVLASSMAAMFVVAFLWYDAVKYHRGTAHEIAVALVAGGGISNVYDRIVKGEVTDYLYVKAPKLKKAPVFNIADVAVLFGAVASFVDFLRSK